MKYIKLAQEFNLSISKKSCINAGFRNFVRGVKLIMCIFVKRSIDPPQYVAPLLDPYTNLSCLIISPRLLVTRLGAFYY